MDRRNIFRSAVAATAAAFAAKGAAAQDKPAALHRAAYHLSDLDKVAFVLGNLRNHMDGAHEAQLIVVINGAALRAFHKAGAFPDTVTRVGAFIKAGVRFEACANTMAGQNVKLTDLLPGFAIAEKGGVVRLAELQHQGWAYLRP
jgi:intracellular sulfur oxidation DsrE/DsrF family protein